MSITNSFFNNVFQGEWLIEPSFSEMEKSKYIALVGEVGIKGAAEIYRAAFEASNGAFLGGKRLSTEEVQTISDSSIEFRLSGVMMAEDGWCHTSIRALTDAIDAAQLNPNIQKATLRVNSGGGQLTAAIMLYSSLLGFTKPMTVIVDGMMASGALLATLPKKVYAVSEFSQIGSIGVMTSISKKAVEEEKENTISVFSRLSPDKQDTIRELFEKGTTEKMQDKLDDLASIFHMKVKQHRKLNPALESKALRGGVFSFAEASQMGLVEPILYLHKPQQGMNKIIAAFNAVFGTSVKENATEEEVVAAINASQTNLIDKLMASTEVQSKISEVVNASVAEALKTAVSEAVSNIGVDTKISEALAKTVKPEQVSALESQVKALTDKVGEIAVGGTKPVGEANPQKPGETVKILEGELETAGVATFAGKY